MNDHLPPAPAPEPAMQPLARVVRDIRDEIAGIVLVLSRIDSILGDAESVWFTEPVTARRLVAQARTLATESLR
jgi:hypothetical protein